MILYGLPTCDTCRKARRALEAAGHAPVIRDIRSDPLSAAEWAPLIAAFGEGLVNRRSTTWRGLSEEVRALPLAELLAAHPALMKRPLIVEGPRLTLGWDADTARNWGA